MGNKRQPLIRSPRLNEEAGSTELPLGLGDATGANSAASDTLGNSTDLGLGGLSLELNQGVGIVVLQWVSSD
jgi:hypothetical protein